MALTGLAALSEISKSQTQPKGDFEKSVWMKLGDGESAKFRFLQEIDGDSKYAREDKGLVKVIMEHSEPGNFRAKMQCSMDIEGKCYGCEQHKLDPKAGWKARPRLYAAVLVKNDDDSVEVQIMSQGVGAKSITPALLEYAQESGAITNRQWKITRNGVETSTSYTLMAFDPKPDGFDDFDQYEVPDLEKVCTRTIPYEEQPAFFNGGAVKPNDGASSSGWENEGKKADSPLMGW